MKEKRFSLKVLFMLVLLFLTTTTMYANAGTGFFFPGIIHVLIGNVIIGLGEAFFIRRVFKIEAIYGFIVLANYVSSILGYIVSVYIFSDINLLSISVLPKALILWFIASVLIEWPFFARALGKAFGFSNSSFKYTFYAQCISYALLVPYHFLTFDEGRMTAKDRVESELNNLCAHAYQYRIRPASMGGGEGSYRGYAIPEKMSQDENARYTAIVIHADTLQFTGKSIEDSTNTIEIKLDANGVPIPRSWIYGGDFR